MPRNKVDQKLRRAARNLSGARVVPPVSVAQRLAQFVAVAGDPTAKLEDRIHAAAMCSRTGARRVERAFEKTLRRNVPKAFRSHQARYTHVLSALRYVEA